MAGFGKYGIGAFASGIAQGFLSGRRLAIDEANSKQRRELLDLEKPALELKAGMARRRAALLGIDVSGATKGHGSTPSKAGQSVAGQPQAQITPADSEKAAEHLRQLADQAVMDNLPDDAAKYYGLANQIGKLSFDNQLNQAMRKALSTNSPQPLADFFASQMPGDTATFEKAKDGSYTVSIWNPDKSLASRETFKSLDGVISHAMQMASPQMYTAIQAGKLKDRLEVLKANAAATRAAAAQTSAEASTRRAVATERNASANERRATAEEMRAQATLEGRGKTVNAPSGPEVNAARELLADNATLANLSGPDADQAAFAVASAARAYRAAHPGVGAERAMIAVLPDVAARVTTTPGTLWGKNYHYQPGGGAPRAPASNAATGTLPAQARAALVEGHITTFANGQKWTLKNGQPERVQ